MRLTLWTKPIPEIKKGDEIKIDHPLHNGMRRVTLCRVARAKNERDRWGNTTATELELEEIAS